LTYSLLLGAGLLIGGYFRRDYAVKLRADAAPHLRDIFAADFDSDAL